MYIAHTLQCTWNIKQRSKFHKSIQDSTPDLLWVGTLLLVDTQLTLACGHSQCSECTPVLECSWGGSDQMCLHSVPSEHYPESSAVASHSKKE